MYKNSSKIKQISNYAIILPSIVTAYLGFPWLGTINVAHSGLETSRDESQTIKQNLQLSQKLFNQRPRFFEEGQKILEQEIQRLQSAPSNFQLTVETRNWQPIVSKVGQFSIWMPPGIISNEAKSLDTTSGRLNFQVIASQEPNAKFLVAHTDELQASQLEDTNTLVTEVRNAIVTKTGLPILSDRSITLGKYLGSELSTQNHEEVFVFRVYLAEKRLYVLGVREKGQEPASTKAKNFLNSFQLLN